MIKTFRYRIYPTKAQVQILNGQLALCCELYNAAVQERREAWHRVGKSITWFDQNRQISQIRKERPDVGRMNAQMLEDVLHRVHLAFDRFFRRLKNHEKAGYPRYRQVARYDSMSFREVGNAIQGSKLRVSKVGRVRIKLHRPLRGTVKTLTVKREGSRWFALFAIDCEVRPLPFSGEIVGIDVGLNRFATLSNGSEIENPRFFRTAQTKLRRLHRRVSRRKKGSNRRRKAVFLLRRWTNRIRDQRRDFHHKESRKIVTQNGLIVVEDLNIKGMARNHKLAKSIHDAAWAAFIDMLTYKAEEAGRLLVKVSARGTSQTCLCGAEVRKTLADRVHTCSLCGLVADRDLVSARLIMARAVPSGANVGEIMPSVA